MNTPSRRDMPFFTNLKLDLCSQASSFVVEALLSVVARGYPPHTPPFTTSVYWVYCFIVEDMVAHFLGLWLVKPNNLEVMPQIMLWLCLIRMASTLRCSINQTTLTGFNIGLTPSLQLFDLPHLGLFLFTPWAVSKTTFVVVCRLVIPVRVCPSVFCYLFHLNLFRVL